MSKKPLPPDRAPRRADREPTASLVARAGRGDTKAQNQLVERYWAALRHWGHGRLPPVARERLDTEDLVQLTLLKTLEKLAKFDDVHSGDFTAYLHQVLINQVRDEIRRARRRPGREPVKEDLRDRRRGPLDETMSAEFVERYEQALRQLSEEQRRAVVLRAELGYTFPEIAEDLGKPSANAARMLVTRALERVAASMDDPREPA